MAKSVSELMGTVTTGTTWREAFGFESGAVNPGDGGDDVTVTVKKFGKRDTTEDGQNGLEIQVQQDFLLSDRLGMEADLGRALIAMSDELTVGTVRWVIVDTAIVGESLSLRCERRERVDVLADGNARGRL
jgi:hypothetical protein